MLAGTPRLRHYSPEGNLTEAPVLRPVGSLSKARELAMAPNGTCRGIAVMERDARLTLRRSPCVDMRCSACAATNRKKLCGCGAFMENAAKECTVCSNPMPRRSRGSPASAPPAVDGLLELAAAAAAGSAAVVAAAPGMVGGGSGVASTSADIPMTEQLADSSAGMGLTGLTGEGQLAARQTAHRRRCIVNQVSTRMCTVCEGGGGV